jgi:hypothetical protein
MKVHHQLLDSGYDDADFLVTAQTQHLVDVVGPAFGSYSRQHQTDKAMIYRLLSWIGTRNRRAVPRAIPVSTGGLGTMSQAIS